MEVLSRIMNRVTYVGYNRIEAYGYDDITGKVYVLINNQEHRLKVKYRPERTWNDHMGNTPCGYYVTLPMPGGSHRRAYLY